MAVQAESDTSIVFMMDYHHTNMYVSRASRTSIPTYGTCGVTYYYDIYTECFSIDSLRKLFMVGLVYVFYSYLAEGGKARTATRSKCGININNSKHVLLAAVYNTLLYNTAVYTCM